MLKNLLIRLSQTAYVQKAISEQADLAVFKQKPSSRTIWGLITIGISYTIGWPVIGILGLLSIYFEHPLIVIIGAPLVYGLSHLVFILGAYLAGADYANHFFRWATRKFMEKMLGEDLKPSPGITMDSDPVNKDP